MSRRRRQQKRKECGERFPKIGKKPMIYCKLVGDTLKNFATFIHYTKFLFCFVVHPLTRATDPAMFYLIGMEKNANNTYELCSLMDKNIYNFRCSVINSPGEHFHDGSNTIECNVHHFPGNKCGWDVGRFNGGNCTRFQKW